MEVKIKNIRILEATFTLEELATITSALDQALADDTSDFGKTYGIPVLDSDGLNDLYEKLFNVMIDEKRYLDSITPRSKPAKLSRSTIKPKQHKDKKKNQEKMKFAKGKPVSDTPHHLKDDDL